MDLCPTLSDAEWWTTHFENQAAGQISESSYFTAQNRRWYVSLGDKPHKPTASTIVEEARPEQETVKKVHVSGVHQTTPVEQDTEMAELDMKREREEEGIKSQAKKRKSQNRARSRAKKTTKLTDDGDIFGY